MLPPIDRWLVSARVAYAPNTEASTSALAIPAEPASNNPKLYRHQLTDHFRQNGLPALSLNYLNKIASLGDGPPVAMIWNRRPLYDPDETVAWLRQKVEAQTAEARERQEQNRQSRQRQIDRMPAQVIAARESA
jgi:hypothetical protein